MSPPSRRDVLIAGAALSLTGCGASRLTPARSIDAQAYDGATELAFAPEAISEDTGAFPLGVQAGAMTNAGALLWGYQAGGGPLVLRVWREGQRAGSVALVREVAVTPNADGYLRVAVGSLAPATWYRYGFFREGFGSRSGLGRFRTAWPDDWAEPLSVGASACTNFNFMPYGALSLTARQPIDLFLHLGDISYNDGSTSLAQFRAKYHRTLKDPGYRELLSTVGWYPLWDDHEFMNNLDPEVLSPAALQVARQAFYESMPVEAGVQDRLWRSYRWGRTAEFFALDCRTERRPSTRLTEEATYLSPEQLAWLTRRLEASTAHFKVLLNSVPIATFPPQVWGFIDDRWQGYAAQRAQLLSFIADKGIPNVWFLTGDFHMGMVHRVDRQGPDRALWEIAVGPGGNANNPVALLWDSSKENRDLAFPPGQFEYVSGAPAATTLLFDPAADSVTVRFLDPTSGAVLFDRALKAGI